MTPPLSVVHGPERLLVVDANGRAARLRDASVSLSLDPRARRGWHNSADQVDGTWRTQLSLPLGAVRARRFEVLPHDHGVAWADSGWVYLLQPPAKPRPVAAITNAEHMRLGPGGTVLIGHSDEGELVWTRVRSRSGDIVALDQDVPDALLTWSPDGQWIHWGDEEHAWTTHLETGRSTLCGLDHPIGHQARLCLDGTCVILGDGTRHDDFFGLETCWNERDELAGPGGRVWDLRAAAPVSQRLPEGVFLRPTTAAAPWIHLAEDGTIRRVGLRGASDEVLGQLPFDAVDAWCDEDGPQFLDPRGACWGLRDGNPIARGPGLPPARPTPPRHTGAWAGLLPYALTLAGGVFAWNDDGLLVRFDAPRPTRP
jgi:hypothetical protein